MTKKKKRWVLIRALLLTFIGVGIAIGVVSNTLIFTTTYQITYPKLPAAFDGFKILQLSDLHSKSFGRNNERLIRRIDRQRPDIIVMTGDMVNALDTDFEVFLSLARNLVERYPVYFIEGNHEQGLRGNYRWMLRENLEAIGVRVLDNERVALEREGEMISLYGMWYDIQFYRDAKRVDTLGYTFQTSNMEALLGKSDPNQFNLLLTHNPFYFETYEAWGADLTLSGHVHGGLVRIPFVGGVFSPERTFFPKYDGGLYGEKDKFLIVNRGLGNSNRMFRFWNCPDLTVVVLKGKSS